MNHEPIYAALFTKLEAARNEGTFTSASRRLKHIEDTQPSEMPAVFQVQADEEFGASRPLVPTIKTLHAQWWVYVHQPDINEAMTPGLNAALGRLYSLFGQDNGGLEYDTLDGQVFNAKINGTVEVYEGILGDKAMAIIPITIKKAN